MNNGHEPQAGTNDNHNLCGGLIVVDSKRLLINRHPHKLAQTAKLKLVNGPVNDSYGATDDRQARPQAGTPTTPTSRARYPPRREGGVPSTTCRDNGSLTVDGETTGSHTRGPQNLRALSSAVPCCGACESGDGRHPPARLAADRWVGREEDDDSDRR